MFVTPNREGRPISKEGQIRIATCVEAPLRISLRDFAVLPSHLPIVWAGDWFAWQKRPGLDQLLAYARRHRFDIVLVAAFDRVARSVRHFLEVLDELNHLEIEFVSFRENIDTSGPLGRAMVVIVGAIAELERNLIIERVRAGMRRARLEGRQIGRTPLDIDREQVVRDRRSGMSLTLVAKKHRISRASVCRLVKEAVGGPKIDVISSQQEHRPAGQQAGLERVA